MQKIARLDYVYQSCGFIMEGQLQQIALAPAQNGLEAALEGMADGCVAAKRHRLLPSDFVLPAVFDMPSAAAHQR